MDVATLRLSVRRQPHREMWTETDRDWPQQRATNMSRTPTVFDDTIE